MALDDKVPVELCQAEVESGSHSHSTSLAYLSTHADKASKLTSTIERLAKASNYGQPVSLQTYAPPMPPHAPAYYPPQAASYPGYPPRVPQYPP